MSTRLLARDLGDCFAQLMVAQPQELLRDPWPLLREEMERLWGSRYKDFVEAFASYPKLKELYVDCPKDAEGYILRWSSTFIGGVVEHSLAHPPRLTIIQAGDSGAVVCCRREDGLTTKPILPTKSRFILQLRVHDDDPRDVTVKAIVPDDGTEPYRFDNVEGFAAMSDGVITTDFPRFLNAVAEKCSISPFREIRKGLVSRADRSYDDKSMVIGWLPEG